MRLVLTLAAFRSAGRRDRVCQVSDGAELQAGSHLVLFGAPPLFDLLLKIIERKVKKEHVVMFEVQFGERTLVLSNSKSFIVGDVCFSVLLF